MKKTLLEKIRKDFESMDMSRYHILTYDELLKVNGGSGETDDSDDETSTTFDSENLSSDGTGAESASENGVESESEDFHVTSHAEAASMQPGDTLTHSDGSTYVVNEGDIKYEQDYCNAHGIEWNSSKEEEAKDSAKSEAQEDGVNSESSTVENNSSEGKGTELNDSDSKNGNQTDSNKNKAESVEKNTPNQTCSKPVHQESVVGKGIFIIGDRETKQRIVEDINSNSYKQYDVTREGKLTEIYSLNPSGSKTYSEQIDKGIANKDGSIQVYLVPSGEFVFSTGQKESLTERGGGETFYNFFDRSEIIATYTGSPGYASGLGFTNSDEVLMHELGVHATNLISFGNEFENAIEFENIMRSELGIELRPSDPWHMVK